MRLLVIFLAILLVSTSAFTNQKECQQNLLDMTTEQEDQALDELAELYLRMLKKNVALKHTNETNPDTENFNELRAVLSGKITDFSTKFQQRFAKMQGQKTDPVITPSVQKTEPMSDSYKLEHRGHLPFWGEDDLEEEAWQYFDRRVKDVFILAGNSVKADTGDKNFIVPIQVDYDAFGKEIHKKVDFVYYFDEDLVILTTQTGSLLFGDIMQSPPGEWQPSPANAKYNFVYDFPGSFEEDKQIVNIERLDAEKLVVSTVTESVLLNYSSQGEIRFAKRFAVDTILRKAVTARNYDNITVDESKGFNRASLLLSDNIVVTGHQSGFIAWDISGSEVNAKAIATHKISDSSIDYPTGLLKVDDRYFISTHGRGRVAFWKLDKDANGNREFTMISSMGDRPFDATGYTNQKATNGFISLTDPASEIVSAVIVEDGIFLGANRGGHIVLWNFDRYGHEALIESIPNSGMIIGRKNGQNILEIEAESGHLDHIMSLRYKVINEQIVIETLSVSEKILWRPSNLLWKGEGEL